jgi:hypothetical protein
MHVKQALRLILATGLLSIPGRLVAHAPQTGHSQSSLARPAASNAAEQPRTPSDISAAALSDFAWLEGRWRGEWGPRIAEQAWLSPKAGAMEGLFRVIEADKTLVLELFTLEQKPDGISLYFRHFTPALAPWEKSEATVLNLASVENKKFTFENPVNGMPKLAAFTQMDADTYVSRSEIVPETGDPQVIEITYKRQPPATLAPNGGSGGRPKKP